MKINIEVPKNPTEPPCLMINDFKQIGLVSYDNDDNKYITIIGGDGEIGLTYQSDLSNWKPLPAGTKLILTN